MQTESPVRSERLTELPAVEAAAWRELERAAKDKSHAWRVAVLATHVEADEAQGREAGADARCIVVREVDRTARALLFFADARSAKVRQIAARPEGTLVLWSPQLSWQLRLMVAMDVETSGLAVSSRWARLKMTPGAQDYLSPLPPGSELPDPHPLPERDTREFFAVVTARVRRMDWLELHAAGHRRAIFDAEGPRWVVP
jgi:hypothetical protein